MAAAENIAKALDLKEQGNAAFKAGDYKQAMTAYHQIFMYVHGFSEGSGGMGSVMPGQTTRPVTPEEMAQIHELKLVHFSNLSMCHLKLGNVEKARANCSKALAIDPKNVKALFRRGKCHAQLNALDEAKDDLDSVIRLEPGNKEALRELQALKGRFASHRKKEQKKFAGMFDRLNAEEGQAEPAAAASTSAASDAASDAAAPVAAAERAGEASGGGEPGASSSSAPRDHSVRLTAAEGGGHKVVIDRIGGAGGKGELAAEAAHSVDVVAAGDGDGDIGEPLGAPQPFEPQDVVMRAS